MSALALRTIPAPEDPRGRARAGESAFDESRGESGDPRPHWQAFWSWFGRAGRDEWMARSENLRRMLREQGVTCFVSTTGVGQEHPWQLDLAPLLIGSEEWRELEAGLRQRARLLNEILQDLYGIQRLLRDGLVPAPLVFANPAYLRPCQGISAQQRVYLQTYAADLARSPDGRWWVVGDRTQAPTGFGFAMQNRSVLSRVLPELMRELQPRPVLDFLRVRRETLRRFAPEAAENPSIALLTPGPRNESYFEHAYLARLLGLTLTEGDDLTVRDRRVWVKTLSGLRPVDVVLRRVSDAYCDPLELRGDSLLGVPGILEAVRAGTVSVANAIGSGLLEGPAFLPFLPGLCRHVLGEDLRLPSLATWWCGQGREQSYVLDHLEALSLRPAFHPGGPGLPPGGRSPADQEAWSQRLRFSPHECVGQEPVRLSRSPCWTGAELAARPLVLRVYVVHDGSDFTVMPGGLAQNVDSELLPAQALRLGGPTKDVWVLPEAEPAPTLPHVVSPPLPHLERAPAEVPSRAADNLFWLGRYTERLEQTVRAARCALGYAGEGNEILSQDRRAPLRRLLGALGLLPASAGPESRETFQKELLALVYEDDRAGGVRDLLHRIHLAAFCVRDRLSADTWHLLHRLQTQATRRLGGLPLVQAARTLHTVVLDLAAFSGMEMENMTRGHGWVFLDLGRRIERGMFMAQLLEALWSGDSTTDLLVEPALEIADSVMTHRRRYFTEPRLASVTEVIVQDAANPRALAFQLDALAGHARALPLGQNPEGVAALNLLAQGLVAGLPDLDATALGHHDQGSRAAPERFRRVAADLGRFSELLTEVYFSHVPPRVS